VKIAIDANEANVETRVGTGQYTSELLSRFRENSRHQFSLLLKSAPSSGLPPSAHNWQYHLLRPGKAWTRFALPLHLTLTREYDVFWNPAHYLPPVTNCPSVVTIHDLAYEYFPSLFLPRDLYKLKRWTRRAVKQATHVIAVSEATKSDLINLYGVADNKITVVYNGYNDQLFSASTKSNRSVLSEFGLGKERYLLFLGTLQPRKNIIKLVQAFRILREGGYQGKLVIAGKVGWLAEETLQVINSSPDKEQIVMTGYVSETTRRTLYQHADVFVLPSLYEGFGVPILEAMASGCPVAASDNSSLPEVVGSAGLLFNPTDPADIARAVLEIKQARDRFVTRGLKHAKTFSWDKCAKETIRILHQAAHSLQET